jgi:hypothetical protein
MMSEAPLLGEEKLEESAIKADETNLSLPDGLELSGSSSPALDKV